MSNSAHDARNPDVPFGVPDPGTGGEFGGANVEDSVRLPHHAEVQPGTFGAGLASALGFDIKAKESYAEQAGEAATKGAESAKSSAQGAFERANETASDIAKATSDATSSQPGSTERKMMDTAGGMMNRVSEAIQSVTPESVKHMEDKVMEKVHSASDAMRMGARTGADVPMPSTSSKDDELSRQQAAARRGMD